MSPLLVRFRVSLSVMVLNEVPQDDMLHFYISIIRPVLEYAVAVWHTGLTADLSDQLEAIQKCALRIIFDGFSFTNQSYEHFTYTLDISPLSVCYGLITIAYFVCIISCLCRRVWETKMFIRLIRPIKTWLAGE